MTPQSVTDSFNQHSDMLRQAAITQDRDDLQHAISGADVGRMRKHIQGAAIDPATGKKRNGASEGVRRTLDWLLFNDPNYARLYEAAGTAIAQVVQRAEETLAQALTKLEHAQEQITDALVSAAKLPDSRAVFRDENGVVKDASGDVIPADTAAGIQWRGDEPSYEDYRALVDRADALKAAVNELRGIETELGGYQGELADNDEPPSQERLEEITERSEDLRNRLVELEVNVSERVSDHDSPSIAAPTDSVTTSGADLSANLSISLGAKL